MSHACVCRVCAVCACIPYVFVPCVCDLCVHLHACVFSHEAPTICTSLFMVYHFNKRTSTPNQNPTPTPSLTPPHQAAAPRCPS